jgi:hypothetical protein
MTSDELADRLINFAARVGKVVDALPDTRMGRHIAGQLFAVARPPLRIMRKRVQRRVVRTSPTNSAFA